MGFCSVWGMLLVLVVGGLILLCVLLFGLSRCGVLLICLLIKCLCWVVFWCCLLMMFVCV